MDQFFPCVQHKQEKQNGLILNALRLGQKLPHEWTQSYIIYALKNTPTKVEQNKYTVAHLAHASPHLPHTTRLYYMKKQSHTCILTLQWSVHVVLFSFTDFYVVFLWKIFIFGCSVGTDFTVEEYNIGNNKDDIQSPLWLNWSQAHLSGSLYFCPYCACICMIKTVMASQ